MFSYLLNDKSNEKINLTSFSFFSILLFYKSIKFYTL